MNHAQNKKLHALLNQKGLLQEKANIISGITKGRSESSKELSFDEARLMITWLISRPNLNVLQQAQDDKANRMRRRIISMAHECGWHNIENGKWQIDITRIDNWCIQYGYLKKGFIKYTLKELPKLVSQFEMVYKSFLKKV